MPILAKVMLIKVNQLKATSNGADEEESTRANEGLTRLSTGQTSIKAGQKIVWVKIHAKRGSFLWATLPPFLSSPHFGVWLLCCLHSFSCWRHKGSSSPFLPLIIISDSRATACLSRSAIHPLQHHWSQVKVTLSHSSLTGIGHGPKSWPSPKLTSVNQVSETYVNLHVLKPIHPRTLIPRSASPVRPLLLLTGLLIIFLSLSK